ncbi:MAG: galactose oxidase, partial [Verrucomicrobiota bacterium]
MKPFLLPALLASLLLSESAFAQIPQLLNYQGRITDGGTNFDGAGLFKFALVNTTGTTNYWSNDGT